MPGYRVHQLERELYHLCQRLPGVERAVLVSIEGLVMATYPPVPEGLAEGDDPTNSPEVAAMSSALVTLGEQTVERLARGALDRIFVEGLNGGLLIVPSGPDAALAAMTRRDAKLGIIFHEMSRTARQLAVMLEQTAA